MLVKKENIHKYIPQRSPMIMVDELLECNTEHYLSQFSPSSENIFITDDFFNESGLVENMAQTAALGVGYFSVTNNESVPLGFIGGIKNLKIYKLPKTEETITTKITVLHKVLNATIAKAEVYIQEEKIAEGEYKIFINPLEEKE
jgi:predicted hotdog family 3-hydroxylacyl-ACP dehydratase